MYTCPCLSQRGPSNRTAPVRNTADYHAGGGRESCLDNLTLATKHTGIEVTYFTVAQTHWPELVTWPHQTTRELKMKSYSGWKWELLMNSNYIN